MLEDNLSDKVKVIILGSCKDPRKHMTILHSISAFVNIHALQLEIIENNHNTPPDPDDDHGGNGPQIGTTVLSCLLLFTRF